MDTNIYAGDGSTVNFTLSTAPDTEQNLMVFIDGVFQAHDSYSVSGTTLTFSTAPASGRVITAYHSTTTVGGSNYSIATMTGDGSDTTLTLSTAPVHENNVQVYFDGVYQSKSNYSISGTTVTFTTAPPSGVTVEAITATNTSITTATQLVDADSDTMIQVEESSDEDKIRFDTGGTERMIIDSTGVGIGTTSPSKKLHVYNTASADVALLESTQVFSTLAFKSSTNASTVTIGIDGAGNASFENKLSSGNMTFVTNGSERMRINSSGNVGIGTSSPDALLDIQSDSNPTIRLTDNKVWNSSDSGVHGTLEWFTTDASTNAARVISYIKSGNDAGSAIPNGYLTFATARGGGNAEVAQERMRIDSSGNLFVGTTDAIGPGIIAVKSTATTTGCLGLHNTNNGGSFIRFSNAANNAVIGVIQNNNDNSTSYITTSDYRLKENVNYDFNALDRISQLKPARFNFINDVDTTVDGFLAHEVQSIVPEAITGEKDAVDDEGNPDYQGIDQSKLVPLLTKAIQELSDKVDNQQTIIDNLTTRIETLENA